MKVERKVWNMCRILFSPTVDQLERKYEVLTNMVLSYGGRIHGSQHTVSDKINNTIVVYFEVARDSLNQFLEEEKKYK